MRAHVRPTNRQQRSQVTTYPAPTAGWNTLSTLAAMNPDQAIVMDNWYPRPQYCELRGGSVLWMTSMAGSSKTLATYNSLVGTNKLFCFTSSGVYEVLNGTAGASVAARTDGKHQWKQFGDGTNNYLIACNGVDKPLYYDGTTWLAVDGATSPALTGITTTSLISVCVFKNRLIFLAKESLAWWYLSAGVAGGALTKFDLSGVCQKGGYLMAVESQTMDAGDGVNDQLCFITSEGEVVIYQGTNPADAAAWSLVGVYNIGKPLGRKCFLKLGSDLFVLTQEGAYPLSTILANSGINYSSAVSVNIQPVFNESARIFGSNFGWTAVNYPIQAAVIVNVPISENGLHYQYVFNTLNRSWCRFTGWNAEDFVVFNNELYYCQGTSIIKAWSGTSDQGADIVGKLKTAFSYFGNPSRLKRFNLFRPVFDANGSFNFGVEIITDYHDITLQIQNVIDVLGAISLWDSAIWNISTWGASSQISQEWFVPSCFDGFCAALRLEVRTKRITIKLLSIDYVFESGGIL